MDVARVNSPPGKPLLVFDGDCNFCRYWIARWQQITGEQLDYIPFQDPSVAERFPELPRSRFEKSVQLIQTDGCVYGGAEAVFRSLAFGGKRWPLWIYQQIPGVAPISEAAYGLVARHRTFFSLLTRVFWGRDATPTTYVAARWLFLRSMGLVYIIAFVSLWTQIIGLIGHNGIVPADQIMPLLGRNSTGLFWQRMLGEPTFCWFRTDDAFLKLQCAAGTILGVMVLLGIVQKLSLFFLWAIYLSLTTVCRIFLGFQWDNLLLEAGLLAIIFAPTGLLPKSELAAPLSKTGFWLLRWLLFRLMFASGCVKLLSDDVTWRNFTALNYHYETQPLPTWIGWYVHHLPTWWHKTEVGLMYVIELVVPFFIFLPRRLRLAAFFLCAFLQCIIAATGNYGFFNLLAIALCLLLLDDAALLNRLPDAVRERVNRWVHPGSKQKSSFPGGIPKLFASAGRIITATVTVLILIISCMLILGMFSFSGRWPRWTVSLYYRAAPFRSINSYGLFSVMTTNRPEIVVEGSADGRKWVPYEFKWKPGDLKRAPAFVEPHMPRLDWQMWFAALGSYRQNPWFINFCYRLLEGSPDVTRLLQTNPFSNAPPQYIRAVVYDYHFSDAARKRDGVWWRREVKGLYCPVISLRGTAPDAPVLQLEP